jgi:hypothetical protein
MHIKIGSEPIKILSEHKKYAPGLFRQTLSLFLIFFSPGFPAGTAFVGVGGFQLLIGGPGFGNVPVGGGLNVGIDFKGMVGAVASGGHSDVLNQFKELPRLVFDA